MKHRSTVGEIFMSRGYRHIKQYKKEIFELKGNPYDNALAENFLSILKNEYIYRTKIRTYEEARLFIGACIQFYNNERIQLKTKLTPLRKAMSVRWLILNVFYRRGLSVLFWGGSNGAGLGNLFMLRCVYARKRKPKR